MADVENAPTMQVPCFGVKLDALMCKIRDASSAAICLFLHLRFSGGEKPENNRSSSWRHAAAQQISTV